VTEDFDTALRSILSQLVEAQEDQNDAEEGKKGVRGCCWPAPALSARWSALTLHLRRRAERVVWHGVRHRAQAGWNCHRESQQDNYL